MGGMSIGNLPNQSILKKINDIAADVNDLDLEGVNNLKSKLSELVAPELGSSDTKAISQKVVTENIERLNTEVNNKINKVESAQNGNLPSFDNGHIKDSKIPASNIAQANGYYESMIVGASRNLAGNNIITAKYTYRPTADTTDVADGVAKISSVKGNTIVWNQRFKDTNIPFIAEGISVNILNGAISINGTINTTYVNIVNSGIDNDAKIPIKHIGYYKCTIVKDLNNILQNKNFALHDRISGGKIIGSTASFIYKNRDDSSGWRFGFSGFTVGDVLEDVQIKVNVFDLTQMFGEGNEPTLEEFESMFPDDYYEYNEGELKSIEDFQIKSVGFNQWDEEYANTSFNTSTGLDYTSSENIGSKNYIPIIGGKEYYNKQVYASGIWCAFFDKNKNIIEKPNVGVDNVTRSHNVVLLKEKKYTAPKNACFMKFYFTTDYGSIYKNDFNINLSHSGIRNGEYEPYQEDILPINISSIKDENGEQLFPNGLCSAGTAHDELIYDKGIGKWKAVKRIGSVDLGTLNWLYYDENYSTAFPLGFFLGNVINLKSETNLITSNYVEGYPIFDKRLMGNVRGKGIYIIDTSFNGDVTTFTQSLQGQILYYELAEPIEVVLDDFTSNYKVSDWGTEEILMNSTPIVPVIYDVEYALNAVDTLRNMPTNYISKESLDAFLSALGSAMGGTWTATWNEDMQKYTFNFTPNAVNVE